MAADAEIEPRVDERHLGVLDQVLEAVREIQREIERPRQWGVVDQFVRLSWAAGSYDDYDHRGNFAGVAIFNESAGDIQIGFTPGAGRAGAIEDQLTLGAQRWI